MTDFAAAAALEALPASSNVMFKKFFPFGL